MGESDPLAAFDDDLFVAHGQVSATDLRDLARRHQESVRGLPGVDNIVYEWRNHFHHDPVCLRSPDVYVLAVPTSVWEEYAADLSLSAAQREALVDLHDRQARRLIDDDTPLATKEAFVLTRP